MNMDNEFVNNTMGAVNGIVKIAANLSDKMPSTQKETKPSEPSNNPHNQTVEVKVGETERKPLVLKEKTETNVYHVFPDSRELSDKECELYREMYQGEHEMDMAELNFRIQQEEEARKERKEREEYARKERERRRKRDNWIAAGFGVVGLGCLGYTAYALYTDSRRAKSNGMALGEQQTIQLTAAEGSVK